MPPKDRKERPPRPAREPSLSILVPRPDLRALHQTGLRQANLNLSLPFRKRVSVEPLSSTLSESIIFAPDDASPLTPTEHARVPASHTALVRRGDSYHVSFVGLSVAVNDRVACNELLFYSLLDDRRSRSGPVASRVASLETDDAASNSSSLSAASEKAVPVSLVPAAPTGVLPSCARDSVYVHYDPVVDGHDVGTVPDTFVPIPAAKARYVAVRRSDPAAAPRSLSVRFTVMGIDPVSDLQARAIAGVDQVGTYVSQAAATVPYIQLLTHAFTVASTLGRAGLKHYSRPDHVLSKDFRFAVAEPGEHEGSSDFLRYGYYFFLDKPVEARLYAQTGSSSQQVPLFLKRVGDVPSKERRYFPLTGVSYVAIKVSRGMGEGGVSDRGEARDEHRRRLENILEMSNAIETLCLMEKGGKPGAKTRSGRSVSHV